MPLLRSQVESVLVRRVGKLLTMAGLDGATVSGSNPDLSDPIADAVRSLGLAVADPSNVSDGDLATVQASGTGQVLDIAELRALESALGNWNQVDEKIANGEQRNGTFVVRLEATIARKRSQVERQYGYGLAELSGGAIGLSYAETLDDDIFTDDLP